jgi:hypothetical protein
LGPTEPISPEAEGLLLGEVRQLHALFFPGEPDPEVSTRYVEAHRVCFASDEARLGDETRRVFALGLDAEAIELTKRTHGRPSVLTRKIQILFYLVEVRSRYYGYFINQEPGWLNGVSTILIGGLRTTGKYAKGRYLIWKYNLA